MTNKRKLARDPFAFSLRGMSALASFTAPVAIADDRLNRSERGRPPAAQAPRAAAQDWQTAEQPGC